ncbi:hypothetical protein ABBQ38_013617 [Trebouxia sp. C0009 RCD-2024]
MFKQLVKKGTASGYQTCIRTTDVFSSAHFRTCWSQNRLCDNLTARLAEEEIADEATCKPAKATSPDRLKADTTTGRPWSATSGAHTGSPDGILAKSMYRARKPAKHEMPRQGHGSHHRLNASRGMTAAAGGAQDNRQQSKVLIDIPEHSLVPRRWSGDIARRPQGTRRRQVVGSASSPKAINAYTKGLQEHIHSSICGSQPGPAMLEFCYSLEGLYSTAAPQMDAINISTILSTLAHEWAAAQQNHNFQHNDIDVNARVKAVVQQSLKQLQPRLQSLGAWGISNIMWSSAKLGVDPDEYVPGMVRTLATMFLQLIQDMHQKRRPNAQGSSNLVWALATMNHPAATNALLDCVCSHFGSLMHHPDARQRPVAQDVANVLWALAELQHSPKHDRLLDDFCMYMHSLLRHQDAGVRPRAQDIAHLVRALAELQHSPQDAGLLDAFCMYMHSLLQRQDANARPNAQDIANLVRALAVLKHPLKDGRLLDDFCMYMHSLLQSRDARARPTAQNIANTLWALAKLQHSLQDATLLDDFCIYMHSLLQSQNAWARPNAQEIANLLWALAKMRHSPKNNRLLDDFCMYMHSLLQRQDLGAPPGSQEVSNALWALARMKHAPPSEVVPAMLDHLVAWCQAPNLPATSQDVSNCFLACAELRLRMHPSQVEVLLKHLLGQQVTEFEYQHCCNVAWSLAVMGCLTINFFSALLRQLTIVDKLLGDYATESMHPQLEFEGVQQLHQALEWLKPPEGSEQMEAWSSLRTRLQGFAPAPPHIPQYFPGHTELYDALASQRLHYKPMVLCGMYQADAVMSPHGSKGPKVILMLQRSKHFIRNMRNRPLGTAVSRLKMLGRYSTVVNVPYKQGRSSVESMAGAIKTAVEAKTGLPLDSFRR